MKAFNKFWGDIRTSLKKIFVEKCDMSDSSAEMVLNTLRKGAASDFLAEFASQVKVPSDNRYYNAGYLDALDDMVRYIRKAK